jgi:uncharacterized protein
MSSHSSDSTLIIVRKFTSRTMMILSCVAILGVWVGYNLTKLIPQRAFFIIVEIALFLISLNLIRVGLSNL